MVMGPPGPPGSPADAAAGRRRRPSSPHRRKVVPAAVAIASLVVLGFSGPGQSAALAVFRFLEFYTGVFALVALSLTVMAGFLATDRHVLLIRHRVLLQTTHGLTAALALCCLAIHIALKVAEAHASVFDVFVPFLSTNRRLFVGLGTIAFYLMVFLTWTGIIRGRFAYGTKPWLWRAMHVAAYPTWLLAVVHGLASGRHAAGWVTVSYVLCLVAVALGVLIRVGVARGRKGSLHTTGSVRPVPAQAAYFDVSAAAAPPVGPAVAPRRPAAVPPGVPPAMPPRAPVSAGPVPPRVPLPPPAAVAPPRQRRGDAPVPPPPPRRSMEDVSDDEFWEHMKGDKRR